MKTESEVKKNVTKDIHIKILEDSLNDVRTENRFIKKTVIILFIMLAFAIAGMIAQNIYHQHKLFRFMENTEFRSEVNMFNDDSNANNMNVERK